MFAKSRCAVSSYFATMAGATPSVSRGCRALRNFANIGVYAMAEIQYKTNDCRLDANTFIDMANQVWVGDYSPQHTQDALSKTINTTAWDGEKLVGCVRVLTDGYFFGTIPEILVLPGYRGRGIGKKLMELAFETSPTSLFFGAQPNATGFYESIGYEKSVQSFGKKKPRRQ